MIPRQLPTKRDERWALLGELLNAWFPASREDAGVETSKLNDAERRLGLRLPLALREWYERYGARADVWSLQDNLWMPDEMRIEDNVLTFCIENQGVVRWGIRVIDLLLEDPAVFVSDRGGRWLQESVSTSAFALQFALLNAKFSRAVRYHADGQSPDAAFEAIERRYPRLPFPDMHWPAHPTRLYGNEEIIIDAEAFTWLWISARSQSALDEVQALTKEVGMDWEG